MQNDSIIDEVRQARQAYASQFSYDLSAMAADLRKKEEKHPDKLVSFPPKPARRQKTVQS